MDGLSITDLVCPRDYSQFLTGDYDDTRLPVDALKAVYNKNGRELQLIVVPKYKENINASAKSAWRIRDGWSKPNRIFLHSLDKPNDSMKNSEFGLKYSVFGNGLDYSLLAFRTWNDNPLYIRKSDLSNLPLVNGEPDLNQAVVHIFPTVYRMTVLGIEAAKAKDEFVYRLESALHLGNRYISNNYYSTKVHKKNDLNIGIGADWSPGNDLDVTAQLVFKRILDYKKDIKDDEDSWIATLRISKKLMRETLKLSTMNYFDISNKSGLVRLSSDYAFTDDLHFVIGTDFFLWA